MVGNAPAYYVTIKKDKKLKGFYWMTNSSKSYQLLNTIASNNLLNMTADKAPGAEMSPDIKAFLETAIVNYKAEIPSLEQPEKAIDMAEVIMDLIDKQLVREDTLGQELKNSVLRLREGAKGMEPPKNSPRMSRNEKIKQLQEKTRSRVDWGAGPSTRSQNSSIEQEMDDIGESQRLEMHAGIFESSPRRARNNKENEDESETLEDGEQGEDTLLDQEGGSPAPKKGRYSADHVELISEDKVADIVNGVTTGCERNTLRIVQESEHNVREDVSRVYDQSKQGMGCIFINGMTPPPPQINEKPKGKEKYKKLRKFNIGGGKGDKIKNVH